MIKAYDGSLYGSYRQLKFTDVYPEVADFLSDYNSIGIPVTISQESATILFYLLYGKYGNSTIASSDINRFKYSLFGIVWQLGPAWEKRVEIQKNLRDMTEAELLDGSKQIYNHAENPGTTPTTDTIEELTYINDQNVSKNRRGRLEAYAQLYEVIKNDVTQPFIERFKNLFIIVVEPELPLLYLEDET